MPKEAYLTPSGLDKVKQELDYLKKTKRKEIALRIQEAKELGDLSENAEYTEAKNEQAFVEGRITELETIIKNAILIDANKNQDVVSIGSTVTVEIIGDGQRTYNIVGSNEADPTNGKISNESPLGQAFLNHRVNDIIRILIPKGTAQARIIAIS